MNQAEKMLDAWKRERDIAVQQRNKALAEVDRLRGPVKIAYYERSPTFYWRIRRGCRK